MRAWTIEVDLNGPRVFEGIEINNQMYFTVGEKPHVHEFRAYISKKYPPQITQQGNKSLVFDINLDFFRPNSCSITNPRFKTDVRIIVLLHIDHYGCSLNILHGSNTKIICQKDIKDWFSDLKNKKTNLLIMFSPGDNIVLTLQNDSDYQETRLILSRNKGIPYISFE